MNVYKAPSVPLSHINLSRANAKSGAAQLSWNSNGSLLLVRFGQYLRHCYTISVRLNPSECAPTVIYLYNFPSPQERFAPYLRSVLIHTQPVLHVQWNPVRKGSLALCCGSRGAYTWSDEWVGENGVEEEMAECIGIPNGKSGVPSFLVNTHRPWLARRFRRQGPEMGA